MIVHRNKEIFRENESLKGNREDFPGQQNHCELYGSRVAGVCNLISGKYYMIKMFGGRNPEFGVNHMNWRLSCLCLNVDVSFVCA